jgi:hypothetical protein
VAYRPFDESHPPVPEDIRTGAEQYKDLQRNANALADRGNIVESISLQKTEDFALVLTHHHTAVHGKEKR